MKELDIPEFPGWNAEVHESTISADHINFAIGTRIPKTALDKLGPTFLDELLKELRERFQVLLDG